MTNPELCGWCEKYEWFGLGLARKFYTQVHLGAPAPCTCNFHMRPVRDGEASKIGPPAEKVWYMEVERESSQFGYQLTCRQYVDVSRTKEVWAWTEFTPKAEYTNLEHYRYLKEGPGIFYD